MNRIYLYLVKRENFVKNAPPPPTSPNLCVSVVVIRNTNGFTTNSPDYVIMK